MSMSEEQAPTVFSTAQWSIVPASGWRVDPLEDGCMMVLGADPTTRVRIGTFDPPAAGMTARHWVELAALVHPPKGRPLDRVQCGDFSGYRTEMTVSPAFTDGWLPRDAPEDYRLRGWMLESHGIPLDVSHSCPLSVGGRDDATVDAMLDSLRRGEA